MARAGWGFWTDPPIYSSTGMWSLKGPEATLSPRTLPALFRLGQVRSWRSWASSHSLLKPVPHPPPDSCMEQEGMMWRRLTRKGVEGSRALPLHALGARDRGTHLAYTCCHLAQIHWRLISTVIFLGFLG